MPEISIIVPTYNECENLTPLFKSLERALDGADFEVVFVDDDSPDGTASFARTLAQTDRRVRIVQRLHRRGLASAVVEGLLATSSPILAVMDADLQHDESILPAMIAKLKSEDLDVVIASRNMAGGSMENFAASRRILSNAGRRLSRMVCRLDVSDPMSGYFVLSRRYLHEVVHALSGVGFKILVDLLASAKRPVRYGEIPYTFRNRQRGESKLDVLVGLEYAQLLLDKAAGGWIPTTYLLFVFVGAIGMIFNFLVAALLIWSRRMPFLEAQFVGALLTIPLNFLMNNFLTFRSTKLQGRRLIHGLALFAIACSAGLFAQVSVAAGLRGAGIPSSIAIMAGIAIGSVWNYSMAYLLVWQIRRRRGAARTHHYLPLPQTGGAQDLCTDERENQAGQP